MLYEVITNHLLAALVHDVEINVRRLCALPGQETLKQQLDPGGVDRGGDHVRLADLFEYIAAGGIDRADVTDGVDLVLVV